MDWHTLTATSNFVCLGALMEAKECREAFEAWVSASGRAHLLERSNEGRGWYLDLTVTAWWTGWQAAWNRRADAQDAATWISVGERLPEPYEDVMVWPYPSDYSMTAQWWKQKGKWQYGDYITGYGHEWVEARGITHWMPLPSAPAAIAGEKKE